VILVLAWAGGGVVLLAKGVRARGQSRLAVMLLGLGCACALALALSAAQLVPVAESILTSVRLEGRSHQHSDDFSVEPYRVVEWLWPNVFGTLTAGNRYWMTVLPPLDRHRAWSLSLYFGALPCVLALGAAGFRGGPRWRGWLTAVAITSLLAAFGKFGTPLGWTAQDDGTGSVYWLFSTVLPGFRLFRYPGKLLTFTALALAGLAGVGWDEATAGRGRRGVVIAALLLMVTLVTLVAAWAGRNALTAAFSGTAGDVVFGPLDARGAVNDLLRGLVHGAIALALGLGLVIASRHWPRLANPAAVIVLAVDLAVANAGLVVTVPQEDFELTSEALEAIHQAEAARPDGGPFRVHRMRAWSPAGWSATGSDQRLRDLLRWERDTLQPGFGVPLGISYTVASESSIEDADYWPFFQPFPRTLDARSAALLGAEPGQRILYYPRRGFDLWNTRYFILPASPGDWTEPNRGYAAFLEQTEMIYPDPTTLNGPESGESRSQWLLTKDVQIRRNLAEYPRAWIVHDVRPIKPAASSTDTARAAIVRSLVFQNDTLWSDPERPVFDPRKTAWVETETPEQLARALSHTPVVSLEMVQITHYGPQRVEIQATLSQPGLVILADAYHAGWRLTIDGAPATILRANRAMRGAVASAGVHRLVYAYEPRSFKVGAALSVTGMAALAMLGFWSRRERAGKEVPTGSATPIDLSDAHPRRL
jgi:hypothetical protein